MTQQELSDQTKLIHARIAEIEDSLPFLQESSKAVEPSVAIGRLTRMDAISDKAVNERMMGLNKQMLLKLSNALLRIEKGTYGKCVACGKQIPLGRLQAVPEALLCVPCADKRT